jgi:hypothetical protein
MLPSWNVRILTFQDPYAGKLVQPREPDPAVRYVGVEAELSNESDQAWNTAPSQFRLHDDLDQEHPSGGVTGSEPRLLEKNLAPGDAARGWVWFRVPLEATIIDLVYQAPSPRLLLSVLD